MSYDNDSYRIDCKYIPKKNEEINALSVNTCFNSLNFYRAKRKSILSQISCGYFYELSIKINTSLNLCLMEPQDKRILFIFNN